MVCPVQARREALYDQKAESISRCDEGSTPLAASEIVDPMLPRKAADGAVLESVP